MSTYINPLEPGKYAPYDDIPLDVRDFLNYMGAILNRSPRTINAYYIDLRTFFRFMVQYRRLCDSSIAFDDIDIRSLNLDFIGSISKNEIYEYLYFLKNARGNEPAARARKLSSIKSFFRYLTIKSNRLENDPSKDVSVPTTKRALPKYLSLEESIELLKNIQTDFYERDYCIITLFLNCGMRLVELVGINLTDFKEDTIRIIGKGNKERLVYLNQSCIHALQQYCDARAKLPNLKDTQALFVSQRTGKRIGTRRVEQIVEQCLKTADLSGKGYSPHKLRHTAATLMYRHGNVDMLELKEILGHEHVSTTEIYTHINTEKLRKAASSTPLSKMEFQKKPAESWRDEQPLQQSTSDHSSQEADQAQGTLPEDLIPENS